MACFGGSLWSCGLGWLYRGMCLFQQSCDLHFERLANAGAESGEAERLQISHAAAHGKQHFRFGQQRRCAELESQGNLAALIDVGGDLEQSARH